MSIRTKRTVCPKCGTPFAHYQYCPTCKDDMEVETLQADVDDLERENALLKLRLAALLAQTAQWAVYKNGAGTFTARLTVGKHTCTLGGYSTEPAAYQAIKDEIKRVQDEETGDAQ